MKSSAAAESNKKFLTQQMASAFKTLHIRLFLEPRLIRLSQALSLFLPAGENFSVLDIGCGSGQLAKQLLSLRPQLTFAGVDVLERIDQETSKWLDYKTYDGQTLPSEDKSFDCSLLIDVLHHTDDPQHLLSEAVRVSKKYILVKDHISDSALDNSLLRVMDWIGNRAYGVHLPYNYLSSAQWQDLFVQQRLIVQEKVDHIGLYDVPFSFLFERKLHFVAKLALP